MQPYPKIFGKLRLCSRCDKKESGSIRVSAANTLDLHQLSNGVDVGANGPL